MQGFTNEKSTSPCRERSGIPALADDRVRGNLKNPISSPSPGLSSCDDFADLSLQGEVFKKTTLSRCLGLALFFILLTSPPAQAFFWKKHVSPAYHPPAFQSSATWQAQQPKEITTRDYAVQWWQQFKDPLLNRLIEDAVVQNLDIRIAQDRILEARAQQAATTGRLLPNINANGSYTRQRFSANGINPISRFSSLSFPSAPGAAPFNIGIKNPTNVFRTGFDAAWEVDIFGRRRWDREQSKAEVDAAIENRRDVIVTLIGEVARNYLELRTAQSRAAIGRQNVALQQKTNALTTQKFKIGLAPQGDVTRSAGEIESLRASIPALDASVKVSAHQLAILTGRTPETLLQDLIPVKPLPVPPLQLATGLPASLILKRPDIRKAERDLAASVAALGSAEAQLYPTFSIAATAGWESLKLRDLFDWSSRTWTVSPTVSQRIFQRRELKANVAQTKARLDAQEATLRQTVLTASREVDDAIDQLTAARQESAALQQAAAQNQLAVNQTTALYKIGLNTYLNVLDAQQALVTVQDRLVQSQAQASLQAVRLYKALGGGWEGL